MRTAISLDPELLSALDTWAGHGPRSNRSAVLRALIRDELAKRALRDPSSDALGVVALLYRHDAPRVLRDLAAVEHRWGDHVRSTQHVHLEGDACVEVVVLLGAREEVAAASEELRGVKGVLGGGALAASPSLAGGTTGHRHPHPGPRARPRRG